MEYEVTCDECGKRLDRDNRRINENQIKDWKQFCSSKCLRLGRLTGKELVCDNPACGKKFYRKLSQFNRSKKHFCSRSCAAIVNNDVRSVGKRIKKCANPDCDNLILTTRTYCSMSCFHKCVNLIPPVNKIDIKTYKERVIKAIKKFVKENNRVPFKQEMNKFYRPSRIVFGTWNQAVKAAGFNPNKLKFTHKYTANDGHICDSLAEKIIDDWLTARKIKHQLHEAYPYAGNFKTDFKVGDYWIEFFGLSGQHKRYDELKTIKLRIAKENKLNLISIYPEDLFPTSKLDQLLNCLLAN